MKKGGLIARMAYSLWLNDPSMCDSFLLLEVKLTEHADAATGSILFGGVDTDKFDAPLIGVPIVPMSASSQISMMNVEFTSLSLNAGGQTTVLQDNVVRSAVLDSGTTGTMLPQDLATTFLKVFGAVTDPNVPQPLVSCNLAKSDAHFVYQFGGSSGPKISIPVADLIEPHIENPPLRFKDGSDACLLGVQGWAQDFLLLGDTFLRSAYVVYDLETKQIALAQAKLNVTSSNVQEITGDSIPGVETVVPSLVMPTPTNTASAILGPQDTGLPQPDPNLDNNGQLSENPGKPSFTAGAQSTGSSSKPKSAAPNQKAPSMAVIYMACGGISLVSILFGGFFVTR